MEARQLIRLLEALFNSLSTGYHSIMIWLLPFSFCDLELTG